MGWFDRKLRKQEKRNEQLAETADSATKAIKSVSGTVTEATKAVANAKSGGTLGAAEDALSQVTKRGPLNKYDDPAFVGQADLNSHILENFSKGMMEEKEKQDKEGNPIEKRAYLKKEYRGKSNAYEGFQKKGLLNKVGDEDENKKNVLVDQMAASRLNTNSSIEDIQREKSEAEEFLDDVERLNPTKSERVVKQFTNTPMQFDRFKKEGDIVFDYSNKKGEKGKYSKQGKKWLKQSNKLVK